MMSYSPLSSNNTLEYVSPSHSSINKESSKRKYFSDFNSNSKSYFGFLEKKGVTNTIWSKRYFVLNDGILKYYSKGPDDVDSNPLMGIDIRQEISLVGALSYVKDDIYIYIIIPGKNKTILNCKSTSMEDANIWNKHIIDEIARSNITALQNSSRLPELVEWYYRQQVEVNHRTDKLVVEKKFTLHYTLQGRKGGVKNTTVFLSISKSRSGLVFRLDSKGKKLDSVESSYNGRLLLLRDIIAVDLEIPQIYISEETNDNYKFMLITKEDELIFECDNGGEDWLQIVEDSIEFLQIPIPSARSNSRSDSSNIFKFNKNNESTQMDSNNSPRTSEAETIHSSKNRLSLEFSINSCTIFNLSSDVLMYLGLMNKMKTELPILQEISKKFHNILKIIPDIKSNKEVASEFGYRIEDIIRIFCDPNTGILQIALKTITDNKSNSSTNILTIQLELLSNKMDEVEEFLIKQKDPGWFSISLQTKGNAKNNYTKFDIDLTTISNVIIKTYGDKQLCFRKKTFNNAIDVRNSVIALGSVDEIYGDPAKIRALARLIQADGTDILSELTSIMSLEEVDRTRVINSHRDEYISNRNNSNSCFNKIINLLYCCCNRPKKKDKLLHESLISLSSRSSSASAKSTSDLEEPLYIQI